MGNRYPANGTIFPFACTCMSYNGVFSSMFPPLRIKIAHRNPCAPSSFDLKDSPCGLLLRWITHSTRFVKNRSFCLKVSARLLLRRPNDSLPVSSSISNSIIKKLTLFINELLVNCESPIPKHPQMHLPSLQKALDVGKSHLLVNVRSA